MTAILDASFLLAAASRPDDAQTEAARRVLPAIHEAHVAIAPALMLWEVGNFVHGRGARWFGKSPAARARAVRDVVGPVELVVPDPPLTRATGLLAERMGLTFYDASYLALAMRLPGSILVTEDRPLLAAGVRLLSRARALDADAAFARWSDEVL